MRVSCLQKDTKLKEAMFDIIRVIGLERASNGESASLRSIFNDIRKAGIEIDLETVGFIYNEVLPRDDANFDSQFDIEEITTKTFRTAVNRLADLDTEEPKGTQRRISEQSVEAAIPTFIVRALTTNLSDSVHITSDQRKLQDALWKGVQRILGSLDSKTNKNPETLVELIQKALDIEKINTQNIDGTVNNIRHLFDAMQKELIKASDEIRTNSEDQYVVDKYNEYIRHLENATYKLLFSKKEAKEVLDGALKKAGFAKTLKNGKVIKDWNKLAAGIGSINDLRNNVDSALQNVFPQDVIERVKDTLENEFYELKAEIVRKQLESPKKFAIEGTRDVKAEAGLNQMLAGRTIGEWIRDESVENVEELNKRVNEALDGKNYEKIVKDIINQKIIKFFLENYAKVDTEEARREIEKLGIYAPSGKSRPEIITKPSGGKTVLQWIKERGIQNQVELYDEIENALSGRNISSYNKNKIKHEFKRILDIDNHAESDLKQRELKMNAASTPKKTDLQRMVELYHLGIFNGAHNKLLYRLIGVNDLVAQDLQDLELLAKAASDLSRKVADVNGYNLTKDVFVNREYQRIQRYIDRIIERNISDKSRLLKILSFIKNFLDLMLTSLLGLPFTISQNILSGAKSVLTGVRFGFNESWMTKTKQSLQTYLAMLKEVTITGQAYGEEIGAFATRELFTNSLQWNWGIDATAADKAKSVLYAATMPMRLGLLAFDSANKIALTNKVFYNMIYNALTEHNIPSKRLSKIDAARFINEALYGQSFEYAKDMAKKILESSNSILPEKFQVKISNSKIITLANDIVKANLNSSGMVDNEVLEAALKSSYHVAGVGLGHEPNNPFSRAVKTYRDNFKRREQKYLLQKDWHNLLLTRVHSTIVNNFLIRFAGGATNWMWIRAKEGLGIGLVTGIGRYGLNRGNGKIDYEDIKTLEERMMESEQAANDMARALIGAAYTATAYFIGFGLTGGGSDDDDKRYKYLKSQKKLSESAKRELQALDEKLNTFKKIKNNISGDRWFRAMAPDLMLVHYYGALNDETGENKMLVGALNYLLRTYYANDQFGTKAKLANALTLAVQGDGDAAWGAIVSVLSDQFTIPLVRQYGEYYRMTANLFRDDVPGQRYIPPTDIREAVFGGGALETIGLYKRNPKITVVKGVGYKSYEKFKELGIERMNDLSPGWWNRTYKGEKILDAAQRRDAEVFYNRWRKETN